MNLTKEDIHLIISLLKAELEYDFDHLKLDKDINDPIAYNKRLKDIKSSLEKNLKYESEAK